MAAERFGGNLMNVQNGSLRLGRLLGVDVFVHWSWLIGGALIVLWQRRDRPAGLQHPLGFDIAVYLCLFCIVLLHEFGHALACKSVGGKAERIVLWPLGGVAYVSPPPRPGAMLWSIGAGPLVNVVLIPVTLAIWLLAAAFTGGPLLEATGTAVQFTFYLAVVNLVLLIFNMLPIYPLDGGQILQALLWFVTGRALSLIIVSLIGFIGTAGLLVWAFMSGNPWLGVLVAFMGMRCFTAFKQGRLLYAMETAPRHAQAVCPGCGEPPPTGAYWGCPCGARFDTFAAAGLCPNCGRGFAGTACPRCQQAFPLAAWYAGRGSAGSAAGWAVVPPPVIVPPRVGP